MQEKLVSSLDDTVLRCICLTILAKSQFLMRKNGTRLENKTPREVINLDRKTEL